MLRTIALNHRRFEAKIARFLGFIELIDHKLINIDSTFRYDVFYDNLSLNVWEKWQKYQNKLIYEKGKYPIWSFGFRILFAVAHEYIMIEIILNGGPTGIAI